MSRYFRTSASFFVIILASSVGVPGCSSEATPPTGGAGTGQPPAGAGSGGSGTAQAGSTGAGTGGSGLPQGGTPGGGGSGGAAGTSTGGSSNAGTNAGGSNAGSSAGGSGGAASTLSPGCNKDVAEDPTAWTTHDITVPIDPKFAAAYGQRRYWRRPPATYDKTKPWPLTIWGQGCGQGTSPENTPMTIGPAAAASVQVELLAPQNANGHCYYAGPDGDDPKTPELPYFDKVLAETLNDYCIDTSKVFVGGYSSGGWLSALISCNRTSVVRGVGWAAAGLQLNHDACTGPIAAIITRGVNDTGTPLAQTEAARDSLIMRNGCTQTTTPWLPGETAFDSSSCVQYMGCMPGYPVVWCPTPGNHTNTINDTKLTPQGFWKFWSTLP